MPRRVDPTIAIGTRVRYVRRRGPSSLGTVRAINEQSGEVLVKWDTYRVTRVTAHLGRDESHVGGWNLIAEPLRKS